MSDPETLAHICDQLAEGKSLRAICREMGRSESTVRYWLTRDEQAFAQYAQAREIQADALFDECLALADGTHESAVEDIQARRLQVDTRKWMAGKLRGKYSDKLVVENKTEVTHRYDLDSLGDERLDELERILADAARGPSGEGEAPASSVH